MLKAFADFGTLKFKSHMGLTPHLLYSLGNQYALLTALGILRSSKSSGDIRLAIPDLNDLDNDGNSIGDFSLSLRK